MQQNNLNLLAKCRFDWNENEPVQSNHHQKPVSQHRFQQLAGEEK